MIWMIWMNLLLLGWLSVCAGFDLRTRQVPNLLTVPVLALAFFFRCLAAADALPWLLSAALLFLWLGGWLPGGDAKGLIALALFDPPLCLAATLGAALIFPFYPRSLPGFLGFLIGVGCFCCINAFFVLLS